MRSRAWLGAAVAIAAAVWMSPMLEKVFAQSGPGIVISEYRLRGPNGRNDEFIELFNGGVADVDVSGWVLRSSTASGSVMTFTTLPANTRIRRGCFYLFTNLNDMNSAGVTPDRAFANVTGTPDNGGLAILTSALTPVDQVGNGPLTAFGEGNRLPAFPAVDLNQSYQRRASSVAGFVDTDDNAADFELISPSTPHNSNVASCLTPVSLTVNGSASPASVEQGQRVVLFATVTPATLPGSTTVQVTADLSAIGGSTTAQFADNGVEPDAAANDNIFTFEQPVPQINPLGARSITLNASDPQGRSDTATMSVTVTVPARLYTPHEIQGAGAVTPMDLGEPIMVRGVVTAKSDHGFFLQTEIGMEDGDPNTSEGLFVPANASQLTRALVGHLMYVKGVAAEIVAQSDPASPSITAVGDLSFIFDLGGSDMPRAAELTATEVRADGTLDQLERFESMRVHAASLTAVSGTGDDGAFYAVLTGEARPFREAGVEPGYPVPACAIEPCHVPVFDGNPERLRVDSNGQPGVAAAEVSTGAVMDVTGTLDFASRTFTILPDVEVTHAGGMSVLAAPAAADSQFTVASFFLGGTVNADRLAKASIAIRDGLHMPDVIGVQEVEDLAALTALAQAIDAGAAAAGQTPPNYAAHFVADHDAGVGVLVKQAGARVTVNSFGPAGTDAVMLRAHVTAPSTMLPQAITVIVPHLLSRDGSEAGGGSGALVREQRKAQAESLADFIQSRQSNDEAEAIVAIGNYNAFAFNDGYVDVFGTVTGNPAAADRVATQTTDLITPDLVHLVELDPAERYSSVLHGNAQALDHAVATANLAAQFAGVSRARINADFPSMLSGDVTSPSRLSDRDPMVVFFNFVPDTVAPVIGEVPANQMVEASAADGAMVSYDSPAATDNLDEVVAVTCAPASGSVFPLDDTVVTCTAQDAAGNASSRSFTVTVRDTTAPALTVPGDLIAEASSAAGAPVPFAVTAIDAVTPSPAVQCSAASGSTFALATTLVQCTAQDLAGNTSVGFFAVTVQDSTAPALTVPSGISEVSSSPAGRMISFTTTATDAVTPSPTVSCTPASGSTFPVGDTVVTCAAADAAGNVATGTFTVTVTMDPPPPPATLPGRLAGAGTIQNGSDTVHFAFDVREWANGERGYLLTQLRRSHGRPTFFIAAKVTEVQMSNAAGYAPGTNPSSGVDTVMFSGTGVFNGASGYRYVINAADRGEPGPARDTFSITVYSPGGQVVLSASGVLGAGNIQSLK